MKTFLLILLAAIFFFSCKKKENAIVSSNASTTSTTTSSVIPAADYAMLKKGNYWVYAEYKMDSLGNGTFLHNDSIYIRRDSVIHGDTFHVIEGDDVTFQNTYMRDSQDYIIDSRGNRQFSSDNFTDTLFKGTYGTAGFIDYNLSLKMQAKDTLTTVPAGTFNALTCRTTIALYPNMSNHPKPYFYDTYNAKNIGRIKFSMGEETGTKPIFTEYRLIRYHVK